MVRSDRLAVLPMSLLIWTALVAVAGEVRGQGNGSYETMPLFQPLAGDSNEAKKMRLNAESLVSNAKRTAGSLQNASTKNAFDIYYRQYFFPVLTHPGHLHEWADARQKLIRELSAPAPKMPDDLHAYLVELIRELTTTIAVGNYHPAARYNAVVMLGELNSKEANPMTQPPQPPEPLIQALPFLLDQLENPQQTDAVRVACLIGIARHVEMDRTRGGNRRLAGNAAETRIVDSGLKLLEQAEPPEGRPRDVHDWMRRRAAEILGAMGSAGGGRVPKALEAAVADQNAEVFLRVAASAAVGRLKLDPSSGLNPSEVARKIGAVAVTACRKELDRVEAQITEEEERKLLSSPYYGSSESSYGSSYGGYGSSDSEEMSGSDYGSYGSSYGSSSYPGSYGGAMAKPFDPLGYRVHLTRRLLKSQLLAVREGLFGRSAKPNAANAANAAGIATLAAAPADLDYVTKVGGGIDAINAVIDAADADDMKTLVKSIRAAVRKMEDDCQIVVDTGAESVEEGLLSNPLEAMNEMGLSGDLAGPPIAEPVSPPLPPDGAAQPNGGTAKPAAAAPGAAAPAAGKAAPQLPAAPLEGAPAAAAPPAGPPVAAAPTL